MVLSAVCHNAEKLPKLINSVTFHGVTERYTCTVTWPIDPCSPKLRQKWSWWKRGRRQNILKERKRLYCPGNFLQLCEIKTLLSNWCVKQPSVYKVSCHLKKQCRLASVLISHIRFYSITMYCDPLSPPPHNLRQRITCWPDSFTHWVRAHIFLATLLLF